MQIFLFICFSLLQFASSLQMAVIRAYQKSESSVPFVKTEKFSEKPKSLNLNHYQLLGLSRSAELSEIKEAFRNKVKIYHPDVNNSKDAVGHFYLIQQAYSVLSDPGKKSTYDQKLSINYMMEKVDQGQMLSAMVTMGTIVVTRVAFPLAKSLAILSYKGLKFTYELANETIKKKLKEVEALESTESLSLFGSINDPDFSKKLMNGLIKFLSESSKNQTIFNKENMENSKVGTFA
mmetsp:Transcript_14548/g.20676  ORF Transcript_14548/g.20676 Transcript_14548/m.20676 type:complete len:235 (+) Transcript_14548:63-767(+)